MNEEARLLFDAADERFAINLGRARSLIEPFGGAPSVEIEGIPLGSDMTRAGVLFAHAALEDLIRSLAEIRLPDSDQTVLKEIPLVRAEEKPRSDLNLGDLAPYRHEMVGDVIRRSVIAYLARATYNNVGEIARALDQIGLPRSLVSPHGSSLSAMMMRRHHIAHRADRYEGTGVPEGMSRMIEPTVVMTWIASVGVFGRDLIGAIASSEAGEGVGP